MPYTDLQESLLALEKHGLLQHVRVPVDKNGEISQVMRWVYLGCPEEERYAILFDRVKGFDIPVVVSAIGASYKAYAVCLGLDHTPPKDRVGQAIKQHWIRALDNPIPPKLVSTGPCKEQILTGKEIDLHRLPIPVWTMEKDKGWDKGYGFITSAYIVTKDPSTGIRNVGTYRCMILDQADEMTVCATFNQHIRLHMAQYESRGQRTPVAVVIGTEPTIGMVSVTKLPYGLDEFDVAGGLRGAPVELVKCESVDLEVPATAEIVIEGELLPPCERDYIYEAPFGEYAGYQGSARLSPIMKVHCITRRRNPIYQAFITGVPSESSKIKEFSYEALLLRQMRALGVEGVVDVHQPEYCQLGVTIVKLRKLYEGHVERVGSAVLSILKPTWGKFIIVVDEDVDIYDWDDVMWNITFKTKVTPSERHIYFIPAVGQVLDYSSAPSLAAFKERAQWPGEAVLIDATRPYTPYPVNSLPPARYLIETRDNWERYGLPPLRKRELPPSVAMEEELLAQGVVEKPEIF